MVFGVGQCVFFSRFSMLLLVVWFFFFFKQKTAYEMRISDWSSDVCSSDLVVQVFNGLTRYQALTEARRLAEERAVHGGADAATLKLVEIEDLPIAYLPGNALRVRARVVGDIADRQVSVNKLAGAK